MQRKIKQLFFNITILLFTICFLILAAEVSVRIISIAPMEDKWVGAEKKYYEYDPLLGWRKIPNTKTTRVSIRGRNSVFYQINSKGFRGPEYPYKKADNEYRVLFLGDSFTEGYMIEMDDHFAEVMKRRLNSIRRKKFVQALNSGTAGYSTDQELLFFQNEGKKYNPDITILMFYENDITYNNQPKDWSMYYKPLFRIKNGELALTTNPVPKPDRILYSNHLETTEKSPSKKLRKWLYENSHLYNLIKDRVNNSYSLKKIAVRLRLLEKPDIDSEKANNNNAEDDDLLLPREFRVWERTPNDAVIDSWKITEVMINKLKEDADSVGSKLLVFNIPFEGSIYKEEWNKIKKKYGLSEENWNVDKSGLELEAICKKNNINFLNPTELLREKAKELEKDGKRLYDPTDHHWTVEGNKFVGDILAEYIASKYLKEN